MRERGFTLLEILVVLTIIAVTTGLLVASRGDSAARELRGEADRLYEAMQFALEQAVLQGREYGLLISRAEYGFAVFDMDTRRWEGLTQQPLAPHALRPSQQFELTMSASSNDNFNDSDRAAQRIELLDNSFRDVDAPVPALLMLSNGELTPFRLRISPLGRSAGDSPDPGGYEVWSDGLQLQLRDAR